MSLSIGQTVFPHDPAWVSLSLSKYVLFWVEAFSHPPQETVKKARVNIQELTMFVDLRREYT